MESLEKKEPISVLEMWKIRCWEATHTRCVIRDWTRTQEREGQRRTGRAKEEELRKVRYKPEELGLYIDDLHAT